MVFVGDRRRSGEERCTSGCMYWLELRLAVSPDHACISLRYLMHDGVRQLVRNVHVSGLTRWDGRGRQGRGRVKATLHARGQGLWEGRAGKCWQRDAARGQTCWQAVSNGCPTMPVSYTDSYMYSTLFGIRYLRLIHALSRLTSVSELFGTLRSQRLEGEGPRYLKEKGRMLAVRRCEWSGK